jgi:hypothetical protein
MQMNPLNRLRNLTKLLREFHDDEAGESSALSNIMLLAIAALVIVLLLAFGKTGMKWLNDWWTKTTTT